MADSNPPMLKASKHPLIEDLLEKLSESFPQPRSTAFSTQTCVKCKESADLFNDKLSKKEYTLSGLCQKCQDTIFG
jgi:hypothetical protein